MTDAYAYDPYGKVLKHDGKNTQPFTFVGKGGARRERNVVSDAGALLRRFGGVSSQEKHIEQKRQSQKEPTPSPLPAEPVVVYRSHGIERPPQRRLPYIPGPEYLGNGKTCWQSATGTDSFFVGMGMANG